MAQSKRWNTSPTLWSNVLLHNHNGGAAAVWRDTKGLHARYLTAGSAWSEKHTLYPMLHSARGARPVTSSGASLEDAALSDDGQLYIAARWWADKGTGARVAYRIAVTSILPKR